MLVGLLSPTTPNLNNDEGLGSWEPGRSCWGWEAEVLS